MADEKLLTQEEFLTYEGLGTFKGLQDAFNDEKIDAAKQEVKGYADDTFEVKGTAQTKMEELANGTVKANTEAIEALTEQVAKDIADAVKAEEDARKEAVKGVQDELDALEQTHADDKAELEGKIQDNADAIQAHKDLVDSKVTTLIGDDSNKSVRTIANEELVKQLIPENAKESLDKLEEIAAWIQSHPDDASAMNKAIEDLTALVGELPEGVEATTVIGAIVELVAAEKDRAEEVEGGLADRIAELEEAVGEGGSVETQITSAIEELDADVTSAEVEEGKGLRVQVVEVDGKVTTVAVTGNYDNSYDTKGAAATAKDEAVAAAATDATTKANQAEANAKAEVTALADGAVKDNADAIAAINNETDGILAQAKAHTDAKDKAMDERVDVVEEAIGENGSVTNAIADAKLAGTNAQTAVETLQNGAVKDNADAIAEIKTNMPTPISDEKIRAMFNKTEV